MLNLPAQIRIFAATAPVDFRKAHDGLVAIVRDCFREDPFDGSLFVFFNKKCDRIKLLLWDENGFWLHYKRLERGTFKSLKKSSGERVRISRAELSMLLEGIDLEKGKRRKHFADGLRIHERGERARDERAAARH
jgi:transposase